MRYSIGDLARRTGLPVRTIRFYSDAGLLPPADRSPANHRRYDIAAVGRLDLIRTLRELGLDLATIARVLAEDLTVAQAAARHADALDVQIRVLRLRRAVLRAVARRDTDPEEMALMHRVVQLSEVERHRLINDFVDRAFGGLDANQDFVAWLRSALPYLPDEPEQRAGRRLGRARRAGPGRGLRRERPADGRAPGRRARRGRPDGPAPQADHRGA